ncbi:hypothetical protein VP1G_06809 [Cytospora mali]|uniref:Dienelactone hydrolase domain-containing protein n=1 Tax=Cytospora mali TaxID=578113 RepID=A0A194V6I7_CYTMA|nr:hypothetical protein VP1G_06809 [Valsa mali var. pyri (nom. inval.)]
MSCKACKEIPPVSAEYTEKGKYETIDGLKTYVTGPADATRAVIDIYDVFGFASQTLQGADRLAEHMGDTLVFIPDFLDGNYASHEWIPPDTPEKQKFFQDFVSGPANIPKAVEMVLRVRREVGEKYPGVEEHVAVGGLCWGGKVAVLSCGKDNEGAGRKFTVSWTAHPGAVNAGDAEAMTVPHICLASPDEPADAIAKVKEVLSKPGKIGHVETYDRPMFHGWMGARANLADETNAKEYERGYKQVADFLVKYI